MNKEINYSILNETDFYPPSDDRVLTTYVEEIYENEFYEYSEEMFNLYEDEGFYEN